MMDASSSNADKIRVRVDPDIADLIPEYLERRREELAQFKQALEQGDHATIQTLAHGLKGSGGGYGFDALTDMGARLEQAAKDQDPQAEQACLREIEQYLARVEVVYE